VRQLLRHPDPEVDIHLHRSARARRFTLRVSARDGSVHLTLPVRAPLAEAQVFLAQNAPWLRERLRTVPPVETVGFGTLLPVEGRLLRLEPGRVRSPRIEGAVLVVPGDAAQAGRRAGAFLRVVARDLLAAATDRHAAALCRAPGRITLRDPAGRWGSCSPRGDLMFSWRLAMAPPAVLDYVAAHEAAHLAEMNHAPAFWALVAGLCPDFARHRVWLRAEGAGLHRYRFGWSACRTD
jgi:predicted metal-dependent hydrolase